jgi:hypothetical protein
MRYVILTTDEDGTQNVWGPNSSGSSASTGWTTSTTAEREATRRFGGYAEWRVVPILKVGND